MTKEQKLDAFSMRLDGATLQEIGDKYGVTRERIRQIVGDHMAKKPEARKEKAERIIFPGIREWAIDHGETPASISAKISKEYAATYYRALTVDQARGPSLRTIIDILQFTGLQFEDAFGGGNAQ